MIIRDIKPNNIYIYENKAVLNDWGSSCKLGVEIGWEGTDLYSEHPINIVHTPKKSDDLIMLLKCVYSLVYQEYPETILNPNEIQLLDRKTSTWF